MIRNTTINNCNDPIFVIGTPRSGTTLTAKILGLHSRIFMPGETHFFDDIYFRRKELGDPINANARLNILARLSNLYDRYFEPNDQLRIDKLTEEGNFGQDLFASCKNYQEIFSAFMSIQMQTVNKLRWGNNAPRDIFNIDEIMQFYPNAKIIVCVRDIRAFLLSYKGKWRVTGDTHKDRIQKLYHPVVTTMLWKASMRKLRHIEQIVPKENILIVRYEDLVTKPEKMVSDICNIVEEKFEHQMLNIDTNNSSSSGSGAGIFTSSLDKWKTELSSEEILITKLLAHSEMDYLGYNRYEIDASWNKIFFYFISSPWALLQGLRANKKMQGNTVAYLFRRLLAFFN